MVELNKNLYLRDRNFMYREYVTKNKTIYQIASELNVIATTVSRWLKKLEIKTKSASEYMHDSESIQKLNNFKYLYDEYILKKRTTNQIAGELDVSSAAVKYKLKKFKIKRRKRGDYVCNKETLVLLNDYTYMYDEYVTNKKSIYKIAKDLKVYGSTVRRSLVKLGISRRNAGECNYPEKADVYKILDDVDFLRNMYINKRKSMDVIATELGVDSTTVGDYLHKYGIKTRSSFEYNSVSSLHLHLLIPLLEKYEIGHQTSFLIKHGGKVVYEIDEYLSDQKIFLELQGLYWHGYTERNERSARIIKKDIRKWKHLIKHFPDHQVIYILESDFKDGLAEKTVAGLCKRNNKPSNWDSSSYTVDSDDSHVREFVAKYHYIGNVPSSKYIFVAKKHKQIVAVAVFSSPSRNEQRKKYGQNVLELSRYCSSEHGTNLNSWFISKCMKRMKERPIITYADVTRMPGKPGHDGTMYRAANFKYLGLTNTNYRYLTKDGKLLHKRAIWTRSKRDGKTEQEQAEVENLIKWYEWPKKVFIYE